MQTFAPQHLNAQAGDFDGNASLGRIVLLPGSPGRAERVAERFENLRVNHHARGHHVFLGTYQDVDVAVVPTGMGCPSTEIIVTELLRLGARQLLRIGTAGAIQPWIEIGDLVIASAAVRDESTTRDLLPPEFPALASLRWVRSLEAASEKRGGAGRCHTGVVHTKASLYAREFESGPQKAEHARYKELLLAAGVLASEMEAAALFVLAGLAPGAAAPEPAGPVEAGALVVVVGDVLHGFAAKERIERSEGALIETALEAAKLHAARA